jgi:hypothetical protein
MVIGQRWMRRPRRSLNALQNASTSNGEGTSTSRRISSHRLRTALRLDARVAADGFGQSADGVRTSDTGRAGHADVVPGVTAVTEPLGTPRNRAERRERQRQAAQAKRAPSRS